MTRLSLSLLGGFQARLEPGSSLTFQTRKAQALLAYLALPLGQAHRRDALAALLWGGRPDEQARTSLRQALHDVRRALGPAGLTALRTESDTVALDPTAVDLDVATFTRLVREGTPVGLAQAATLYRGDLLVGLNVKEEPLEVWLREERERVREMAMDGLARLLSHQREAGALEAAVGTAHRLLALDPLQEAVHRGLMRLHAQLGRRAAALRQYQHCVTVLQRELEVEPEAETRQLYQEILRRRAPAAGAAAPGLATSATSRARPAETPLVGREAERARLRDALDGVAAGRGRVLALLGEAGIGKTRLVEELIADAVQRDCRVLVGRAYESDQILTYGPWVDALRAGDLIRDRDVVEALASPWRAELARLLPELADVDARPASDRADHRRLFEGIARLLTLLAARSPVLLVLEDLHWADEMSVRLVAFLGRRLRTERMLVVVTARVEELADVPMLRHTLDDLVSLSLAPLSQPDTMALVRGLARPVEAATAERLGERVWLASEGNPFVVVETMRAIHDGTASGDVPLVQPVREAIGRRLERLDGVSRFLVTVAAVIGREFEFQLLHRASGLDENAAAEGVEGLVRRCVLTSTGERLDFTHDRVREVGYATTPGWRRKRLHQRAGEAIEALYAADLEAHYETLGAHYRDAETWDKATDYLHRAGRKAASRAAYRRAVACFEQALAALEHRPEGRETLEAAIAIRVDLGPALMATSSFSAPEVGATYSRAREQCERLGETPHLFEVLWGLTRFHGARGDLPAATELGEQLLELAQRREDAALRLEAHHTQMATLFSLGELVTARAHAARGLALYDPAQHGGHARLYGNHDPGVCFRTHEAWALWLLGYPARALGAAEDAVTLARELEHPYTLAHALYFAAWLHLQRGDREAVRARTEEFLALASERELPRWLALGAALRGHLLVEQGEIEEGIAGMRQGAAAREWRDHIPFTALLADACGRAGRIEEGLRVVEAGLARASETGVRYYEAELHRIEAELRARSPAGSADEAERCLRRAIEIARGQQAKSLELRAVMSLCRLWGGQGRRAAARDLLVEIHGGFTEGFDTIDLTAARVLLEELASGGPDEAVEARRHRRRAR